MNNESSVTEETPPLSDWCALEEFAAEHAHIVSMTTLRWQLRHRDTNGLAQAVARPGKKMLISKSRYARWLASRAGAA